MSKFNIYSSSAGSGKTFTLTTEYLKLLFLNSDKPFYFKQILAITFTNDAATEMKDRILQALKEISDIANFNEKSKSWDMFQKVAEETNLSRELIQEKAGVIFRNIIFEYSDFAVKTIDSFVNQLVTAFTEELHLPFNYEIVLDTDRVMTEAAERLIEKAGDEEHEEITRILESFIEEKVGDGQSWNFVTEELARFGNHLINDQYYSLLIKLDGLDDKDFDEIAHNIQAYLKWFENTIISLATRATELIESEELIIDDFTQKGKGIGAYFYNMREDFENEYYYKKDSPNTYHWAAIRDDKWYSERGTPPPIRASIDSIKEELRSIFYEMQDFKDNNLKKYTLFNLLRPNLRKLSLLKKIKTEFDKVLGEKNQVFIAEFNRKILNIILSEPVPFIYERIGEKYKHMLIDEFQDTSDMQFYNLLPLIENSLAGNNFNLIVGDAKQAIYRWRGGKMELIVHLFKGNIRALVENPMIQTHQVDQFISIGHYLAPKSLTTNYRSAQEIIDFNNRFFYAILQIHSDAFHFLPDVYKDFRQEKPVKALAGGHIQLEFLEYEKENTAMINRTLAIIQQVLQEGYSQGDIAILCRRNKESAMMANSLTDAGYQIISRDSLLLKNASTVRLLVAFMQIINQPDNRLVKSEAAYLFYQTILHRIPDSLANTEIAEAVEANNPIVFYQIFAKYGYHLDPITMIKSGIYELAEKIIDAFDLFNRTNQKNYLFRFLDVVLNYSLKESNHLQDFLAYWEDKKDSSNLSVKSPADQNAITITTIHRSKGLEYPVVIIPHANWSLKPLAYSEMWSDLEVLDYEELSSKSNNRFSRLLSSPIKFSERLKLTDLVGQYNDEIQATFLENLNMLYVAFTRAADKLFVISQKNHFKNVHGVGELIKDFLTIEGLFSPELNIYEINKGSFIKKTISQPIIEEKIYLNRIISEDRSDRLRLRRLSEKIFDTETLEKSKDKYNKVRAAFAKIRTHDDIPNALRELEFEGIISTKEGNEMRIAVETVINLSSLRPLFEEDLIIENEREILLPNGEIARPDRVVIKDDMVYIINYKPGRSNDFYQKERDIKEIRDFGKLYQQMGFEKLKLMIVYLASTDVISVSF
ncbi:exodeoxyribonuclease V subunit beta [Emticicia sp. BO119]|uniref:UvrD-helicase domain-containing protein n=1 Tax=Emticicia sp. BO119 TaxID=2757768 RepID=UPI0015F03ECC|nr:UvrD-helicase domain-containing protein [Emticicia sp. BO119]MBA4854027.1 UvrD-helicase domain-containing protein [Emticicia sp. BO119]